MANALGTLFADIATAIREKIGKTGTMKPAEFPKAISGIEDKSMGLAYGMIARDPKAISGNEKLLEIPTIEYEGSTLGGCAKYAFAGFQQITHARLAGMMNINDYAFAGCSKLKVLDITASIFGTMSFINMYETALYGCTALESLILRGDGDPSYSAFRIGMGNSLSNVNNTFYIYVPDTMYNKTVSDNPIYASRIRKLSEYPEIDNWTV